MVNDIQTVIKQFQATKEPGKMIDYATKIINYYRYHSSDLHAVQTVQIVVNAVHSMEKSSELADLYKDLSLFFFNILAIDKALEIAFQAVSICKTLDDKRRISEHLCNIGVFHNAMSLFEQGKEYFLQSLQYYEFNIPARINLGESYSRKTEFSKALKHFHTAIKIAQKEMSYSDLAFVYKSIGETHSSAGEYLKAIEFFDNALDVLKNVDDEHTHALVLIGQCYAHFKTDNLEQAQQLAEEAIQIAGQLNSNEIFYFSYNMISELFEEKHAYKEALHYKKLSQKIYDKIHSTKITRRTSFLEAMFKMERKELETKTLLEKSARMASIGAMTAGITHEINQPLNSIVINTESILFKDDRENLLPEMYRQSIEKILNSAQRIEQIIKHTRAYWNANSENQKFQEIDISSCIANSLGMLNQQLLSHGIDLNFQQNEIKPKIFGSKIHLEQIITNLVSNAIFSLDHSKRKEKAISIRCFLDGKYVQLEIEDNGIGLEVDPSVDIFDPFFTTKQASSGMGLGLSIVKNYVNQMNGRIVFQNGEEHGVIFRISFPKYEEDK